MQTTNHTQPDFMDTAQTLSRLIAYAAFVVLIVMWGMTCLTQFGLLGALFAFALGIFFAGLLIAPVVGILATILGVAITTFLTLFRRFKKAG